MAAGEEGEGFLKEAILYSGLSWTPVGSPKLVVVGGGGVVDEGVYLTGLLLPWSALSLALHQSLMPHLFHAETTLMQ